MRLRALVSAAGSPKLVSSAPLDVLENGVAGARWTVADTALDDPLNEARAALLRALQTRTGTPSGPLQQALVRLPRRLSGPRLHGGPISIGAWQHVELRCEERGNTIGWVEAIRWLRGRLPTAPERVSRERLERAVLLTGVELVPACWELSFRGAGLGLPKPLPRRRRRGQTIARSGDIAGRSLDVVVYDDLLPLNSEAVAREVGKAVTAAGATATDIHVDGGRLTFTAIVDRPAVENPEVPVRLDPDPPPSVLRDISDVEFDIRGPNIVRLHVHGIRRGRSEATYIAARSPERAVSLAARGYNRVYETLDGFIAPLPPLFGHPEVHYASGGHIRTVAFDLTGGAPSIEIPEFEYMAIARIEHVLPASFIEVRSAGQTFDCRYGAAILDTLRSWLGRPLNLRIESSRQRRQVPCTRWEVSSTMARFFIKPQ